MHDVNDLDQLVPEAGAIYVMDRGYIDFERLGRFHESGSFFVIRAKKNLKAERRYARKVDKSTGLVCDQSVPLTGFYSRVGYPAPLRRVRFNDPETGKRLVFLPNNSALPALTITELYRQRWQVELFFKWIKQHLRIKVFFCTSENAVKSQIWIAVSVDVLETILARSGFDISRATMAAWMIRLHQLIVPLMNLMDEIQCGYDVLQMDETTVQVLKEDGRAAQSKSRMWVRRGGPPDKPIILFNCETTRSGAVALRLLEDFRGYLQSDGYSGYTAKANGLEPYAYLKLVFAELPKAVTVADVEALLPWHVADRRRRASPPEPGPVKRRMTGRYWSAYDQSAQGHLPVLPATGRCRGPRRHAAGQPVRAGHRFDRRVSARMPHSQLQQADRGFRQPARPEDLRRRHRQHAGPHGQAVRRAR